MACLNMYLDTTTLESYKSIIMILTVGIATVTPAALSYFIAKKTQFNIRGINPYKIAADSILILSLFLWFYLLFIRDRPECYDGASHMYIATWPISIGLLAILLYILSLLIHFTFQKLLK